MMSSVDALLGYLVTDEEQQNDLIETSFSSGRRQDVTRWEHMAW